MSPNDGKNIRDTAKNLPDLKRDFNKSANPPKAPPTTSVPPKTASVPPKPILRPKPPTPMTATRTPLPKPPTQVIQAAQSKAATAQASLNQAKTVVAVKSKFNAAAQQQLSNAKSQKR